MSVDLSSLIAATARWLVRAYPTAGGTMNASLAEAQARQAVTVAAWLRYPTQVDVAVVGLVGPGGSGRLDWLAGAESTARPDDEEEEQEYAWRTWVDEVVASWAASLLTDPYLAARAVAALAGSEHTGELPLAFRRLTAPDERDRRAAPLLRHPDLLAPVAELHLPELLACLDGESVGAP